MTARVLVVDDILANVRLLEAKLSAEYFDVVTAMNGADALDSIQRTKPDIVLLDVMMPGIDGVEVCRQIKNNAQTHHIPVVMVTALDQPEDRVKGLEAGADDFLTKPVNDLALFCRVKSLVRLKMLTDELRARSPSVDPLALLSRQDSESDGRPGKVLVIDTDDHQRLLRALDMGVNDYLIRPLDRQELLARVHTQIRRCRYADQLRSNVQASMEMAVTDALTGLYNRRYMENQTAILVEHA